MGYDFIHRIGRTTGSGQSDQIFVGAFAILKLTQPTLRNQANWSEKRVTSRSG